MQIGALGRLPSRKCFVLNEFRTPWLQLSLDMMRLSFEAQSVIGLRLFRMATGGVPAGPEGMHVTFADIQRILVLSAPSGQPQEAAPRGVRHEAVMSSSPDQNEPLVTPRGCGAWIGWAVGAEGGVG
jgi:hypothetical protein